MQKTTRRLLIIAGALIALAGLGCTAPVYHHAFITKYDASMKVIGYEEVESITQQDPNTSVLKVKISHKGQIED